MESGNAIVVGEVVSGIGPNELAEVRRLAPFGNKPLLDGLALQARAGLIFSTPPCRWASRTTNYEPRPRDNPSKHHALA